MSNDVVLSAALRSNLLALQNTQSGIDKHQNNLATGKKVNSALDNPQSYFAAQSLSNRASDLTGLLDSIGQSIQVIQAANNGVTALNTLVTTAQGLANSAYSTLAGASTQASVTGNANLGTGKLSQIAGLTAAGGDSLTFTITDPTSATGAVAFGATGTGTAGTSAAAKNSVSISSTDTAADLVTRINDLNTGLATQVVTASLDANGHLAIAGVNGGAVNVKIAAATSTPTADTAVANALGFSGIAQFNQIGVATAGNVGFTATAGNAITSTAFYTSIGTLATGSSLLKDLENAQGTGQNTLTSGTDKLTIKIGGKTSANLLAATSSNTTIQQVVDAINTDSNIKSLVSASFNSQTGQISLTPTSGSSTDAQFAFTEGGGGDSLKLGFTSSALTSATAADVATETVRFGAAAGSIASLQSQYNTTLANIDSLVQDTGYAGTNLLNGNNLTTFFNETHTSSLVTNGAVFNSAGLGLTQANFTSQASVNTSISQTQNALTTIRNFGGTIATNLNIIQNRQTFTTSLVNTLQTGSDNLTNADQNQESADLLALQTRQSLGVTALSLASQSNQSVLKLF